MIFADIMIMSTLSVHKLCSKIFNCKKCKYYFCTKCAPDCESEFCDDEYQCPNCTKIYQLSCDNLINPFDEDEIDEIDENEKFICDNCLSVLSYCKTCCLVCKTHSVKHQNHQLIDLSKKKHMHQFKMNNQSVPIEDRDSDNRSDVIEIIGDDIKNIDNNLIKYEHFFPNIISLGDILLYLVSKNKIDNVQWFIKKYHKQQDIEKLINTPVHGCYAGSPPNPPLVEASNKKMLDLLLKHGGDINAHFISPHNGKINKTCLISHINDGYDKIDFDFLDYLHKNGADVNLGEPLDRLAGYSLLEKNEKRRKIMYWLYNHGAKSAKLLEKYPKFGSWYNESY